MIKRSVECPQRKMRVLSLKIAADGTASGTCASNVVVTKPGTGSYLVTFKENFRRAPEAMITTGTNDRIARVGTVALSSVEVITEDLAGAAADAITHVFIIGSDDQDFI
jgi:hypothetical protein